RIQGIASAMNDDLDLLIRKMAADHQPELPSSGLVWWRAQILKKQKQKERIERPVTIMRIIAAAVCMVVLVGLWLSQGNSLWQLPGGSALVVVLPILLGGAFLIAAILTLMWRITAQI